MKNIVLFLVMLLPGIVSAKEFKILGMKIQSGYIERSGVQVTNPYSDRSISIDFQVWFVPPWNPILQKYPDHQLTSGYRQVAVVGPGQSVFVASPRIIHNGEYVVLVAEFPSREKASSQFAAGGYHWQSSWTPYEPAPRSCENNLYAAQSGSQNFAPSGGYSMAGGSYHTGSRNLYRGSQGSGYKSPKNFW